MPAVRPTVAEISRRFAALVRAEVNNAAGADAVLQDSERDLLTPFVGGAAQGASTVDDAVDAAMAQAHSAWAQVNQPRGPGKAFLSQAELARLDTADAALGTLTRGALAIALKVKQVRPPLTVTLEAPAGVAMSTSGVRVIEVGLSAGPSVPVGTRFTVRIDGVPLTVERTPGGLDVWNLRAPEGYGLVELSRGAITDPTATCRFKVTRDSETMLPHALVVQRAKAALTAFVKNTRSADTDWASYFPAAWADNVAAGVLQHIDGFFTHPETEVHRKKDTVLFVGRGPYGLYTEVEVDKREGKLVKALVEID